VFFLLAYRFDNRLVLSLALSSLAGWFGVRVSAFRVLSGQSVRVPALTYGGLVAAAGAVLHARGIKRHFLETYLHVAAHVLFIALVSGVAVRGNEWLLYLAALLGLSGLAIAGGVRYRRFAFVAYGALYGYIGISVRLAYASSSFTAFLAYFVVSGTIVIVALVILARRFGREE
jgi:hypothetical protein